MRRSKALSWRESTGGSSFVVHRRSRRRDVGQSGPRRRCAMESRRILIVANRTAATPALIDAVRTRAAEAACQFTLLVPRTFWDGDTEESAITLELAVPLLEEAAGSHVEGLIGDTDPFVAVTGALEQERVRRDHHLHAAGARVALAAPRPPRAGAAPRTAGDGHHRARGRPAPTVSETPPCAPPAAPRATPRPPRLGMPQHAPSRSPVRPTVHAVRPSACSAGLSRLAQCAGDLRSRVAARAGRPRRGAGPRGRWRAGRGRCGWPPRQSPPRRARRGSGPPLERTARR